MLLLHDTLPTRQRGGTLDTVINLSRTTSHTGRPDCGSVDDVGLSLLRWQNTVNSIPLHRLQSTFAIGDTDHQWLQSYRCLEIILLTYLCCLKQHVPRGSTRSSTYYLVCGVLGTILFVLYTVDLIQLLTYWWRFGAVGSDVGRINEVTLRRARLVLG